MTKIRFTKDSFVFFEELVENNNREWFHAHKKDFQDKIERPLLDLLDMLSHRLSDAEVPLRGGAKTTFKMNRDVRFSADKSLYKTSISALLTPSGTKEEMGGVIYVSMDQAGGLAAAGWYKLPPKALKPLRQKIIEDETGFDRVRDALSKAGRVISANDTLSSMPRGFEAFGDHRHADIIKLKMLVLSENLPKSAFLKGDVVGRIEALARDAMPLLQFFRPAV